MAKTLKVLIILIIGLVITAVIALFVGGAKISLWDTVQAFLFKGVPDNISVIIWQIRFPRVMLGLIVGMGLASSGCVFQGMLRNPLAEPYTLGVSGGAALGAAAAIAAGLTAVSVLAVPLSAFAGALISISAVYLIAARKNFSNSALILGGVVLGFISSSTVLLIMTVFTPASAGAGIYWLLGDLSSPGTSLLKISAAIILPGVTVLTLLGRDIDILTLGEEKASSLGVEPEKIKKAVLITASFIIAACVSVSGIIGFVGLIVPHFARKIAGVKHALLIPCSGLCGAIFLCACDILARNIVSPVELPVGVITGIIGGIFFLIFMVRSANYEIF